MLYSPDRSPIHYPPPSPCQVWGLHTQLQYLFSISSQPYISALLFSSSTSAYLPPRTLNKYLFTCRTLIETFCNMSFYSLFGKCSTTRLNPQSIFMCSVISDLQPTHFLVHCQLGPVIAFSYLTIQTKHICAQNPTSHTTKNKGLAEIKLLSIALVR